MAELLFKFLTSDGKAPYRSTPWSLPTKNEDGTWTPGEWMPKVEVASRVCVSGWHFAIGRGIMMHSSNRMFVGEVRGEVIRDEYKGKIAAEEARLLYEVEAYADNSFEMRMAAMRKAWPFQARPKRGLRLFDAIASVVERGTITRQEWDALDAKLSDYRSLTLDQVMHYNNMLRYLNPSATAWRWTISHVVSIVGQFTSGRYSTMTGTWVERQRAQARMVLELCGVEVPESLTAAA